MNNDFPGNFLTNARESLKAYKKSVSAQAEKLKLPISLIVQGTADWDTEADKLFDDLALHAFVILDQAESVRDYSEVIAKVPLRRYAFLQIKRAHSLFIHSCKPGMAHFGTQY